MLKLDKTVTFALIIIAMILLIISMLSGIAANKEISLATSASGIIISMVIIFNGIRSWKNK